MFVPCIDITLNKPMDPNTTSILINSNVDYLDVDFLNVGSNNNALVKYDNLSAVSSRVRRIQGYGNIEVLPPFTTGINEVK